MNQYHFHCFLYVVVYERAQHSLDLIIKVYYWHVLLVSMWCIHIIVLSRPLLGKKLRFILSVRSDFHMTDSLSIAVHDFASRVLMLFSDGNYTGMLRAILNKFWRQHPTKQQLYGHCAGHCWRSKDELISDILLWTASHEWAKVGRPARTYIQQLCADTRWNLEDIPGR